MSRRPIGKTIRVGRAHQLIRQFGGTTDHQHAAEWERVVGHLSRPDEEVFCLRDGRIVVISYGTARTFASTSEYRELLAYVEEQSRRQRSHPLGARFPRGEGFIEAVPALVQELSAKLRLAPQSLNGTVESLERIDRAARRLGGPEWLDDPTILAPVVAYVGEVMRQATDGRWEIRGADDSSQWQPIVLGTNGRVYPTFAIFKELLERGSIFARVSYDLANRHL